MGREPTMLLLLLLLKTPFVVAVEEVSGTATLPSPKVVESGGAELEVILVPPCEALLLLGK